MLSQIVIWWCQRTWEILQFHSTRHQEYIYWLLQAKELTVLNQRERWHRNTEMQGDSGLSNRLRRQGVMYQFEHVNETFKFLESVLVWGSHTHWCICLKRCLDYFNSPPEIQLLQYISFYLLDTLARCVLMNVLIFIFCILNTRKYFIIKLWISILSHAMADITVYNRTPKSTCLWDQALELLAWHVWIRPIFLPLLFYFLCFSLFLYKSLFKSYM